MSTALRSAPGSKTDRTMQQLAALKRELERAQAHQPGKSKSARKRQAKKNKSAVSGVHVEIGSTGPGERPKMNTGSLQAVPPSGRVTRPKGYRLKAFSDYIPGMPGDWTDPKARNTSAASPAVLRHHWASGGVDRQSMAFERANTIQRDSSELARMHADSVSGAAEFQTYAVRHEDDAATGVMRDGLGRVIRTLDMPDVECKTVIDAVTIIERGRPVIRFNEYYVPVEGAAPTPREIAARAGVPNVRTLADMRTESYAQRAADKQARADERAAKRAAREATREMNRANRAALREEASAAREENSKANKQLRELAQDILAKQGTIRPTGSSAEARKGQREYAIKLRNMLEFFATNMQRAEYVRGNMGVAA